MPTARTIVAVVAVTWVMGAWATIVEAAQRQLGPTWSTRAIVETPKVQQTIISGNGRKVLCILRINDIEADKRESVLFEVSLDTGRRRDILRSAWISDIAHIPDTNDWSMLADIGKGVQLYRLSEVGVISPIVVSPTSVIIGADPNTAVKNPIVESDLTYGILGYGWSDDGKSLWYSRASVVARDVPRMETLSNPLVSLDVYVPNVSELHVVDQQGLNRVVASARGAVTPYPSIVYGSDAASWLADAKSSGRQTLAYRIVEMNADGTTATVIRRYDPISGNSVPIDNGSVSPPISRTGPHGGLLKIVGKIAARHLVEQPPLGTSVDYGPVSLSLTWWNSRSDWHFPSLGVSVHGVRFTEGEVRNGLIRLTTNGGKQSVEPTLSLNACDFSEKAATGVCVREGRDHPPELVAINVKTGHVTTLGAVDARYEAIKPLRSEPKTWNAGSLEATGFLLYPRNYHPEGHYPAIILTHGYDADNSFANKDFQWSYPAQVWAERGYVVIAVNDIPITESEERAKAYKQWASASNDLPVDKVYDLIWRDNVKVYAAVIQSLAGIGLIDPDRVGIAGFSRGSQMVEVAISQTHLFKAASSGDGGMFAPTGYWSEATHGMYKGLFGGSPFDPRYVPNWQALSPTVRADQVRTPVLFQIAKTLNMRVDFFQALRDQSVPAEFAFWPTETHQFHSPVDQMTAMEQNLDWFDFWLRDIADPAPEKHDQYTRWRKMRAGMTTR